MAAAILLSSGGGDASNLRNRVLRAVAPARRFGMTGFCGAMPKKGF